MEPVNQPVNLSVFGRLICAPRDGVAEADDSPRERAAPRDGREAPARCGALPCGALPCCPVGALPCSAWRGAARASRRASSCRHRVGPRGAARRNWAPTWVIVPDAPSVPPCARPNGELGSVSAPVALRAFGFAVPGPPRHAPRRRDENSQPRRRRGRVARRRLPLHAAAQNEIPDRAAMALPGVPRTPRPRPATTGADSMRRREPRARPAHADQDRSLLAGPPLAPRPDPTRPGFRPARTPR